METSLTIFLLTIFIVKGLSLECEECTGIGDCSGNMRACALGKDRCSITYLHIPLGVSQIIKTCVPSIVCDKGIQVINLGQTGTVVAQLTCCEGDECRKIVPPALPEKTAPNGKQCPACFSLQKGCYEEVAYCNGDELYCAEGFLESRIERFPLEFSLKGCANKAVCDYLFGYETMITEDSTNHSIQCTPASSEIYQQESSTVSQWDSLTLIQITSRAVSIIPRWLGLFIPTLSGILLGKLLWIIWFIDKKPLWLCYVDGTSPSHAGNSLQCETCEGWGNSCNGTLQTCPANMNKCGIFLLKNTIGIKIMAIKKTCVPSDPCSEDTGVINMGKVGMIVSHLFCCLGNECKKINPILPSIDMKPNGNTCPGCYTLQGNDCGNEIVQCTGKQDHCFAITGKTNLGETILTITLKGCANKHLCAELRDHSAGFGGMNIVTSSTCQPAKSKLAKSKAMMHISWIARIISGQCGRLFQALTVWLLMFLFL
ncbi:uncharacterized protein LOC134503523 [Candoia aspera]|uniref:uncharacterized protein LOC134503523 n=1 Tax=Candoia aspera TaxID=51853 RepID=UPI002FD8364B